MSGLLPKSERDARHITKRFAIAQWLCAHRFTSRRVAELLLGVERNAATKTLASMHRAGLLRRYAIAFSGGVVPVYGLTPHGHSLLLPNDNTPSDLGALDRAAPGTVLHALAVQTAQLRLQRIGYRDFVTPRDLILRARSHRDRWLQTPDLLAVNLDGATVAIEVERWYKNPTRYRSILAGYLRMLKTQTVHGVVYVAADPCSPERLRQTFSALDYVVIAGRQHRVTVEHFSHFSFLPLESIEHGKALTHSKESHHHKTFCGSNPAGVASAP